MTPEEINSRCRIILASGSPRRRELLRSCDLDFELAAPYDVDESWPAEMAAESVPEYLAGKKSAHFPHPLGQRDVLITADTVVIAGGRIFGKPATEEQARSMLHSLSGRTHSVVTGVMLRSVGRSRSFSVSSSVRFASLGPSEIDYYVERYRPLDKAGSYGIQEWIGCVGIEGIEGSFYNVMGLPVQRLWTELSQFVR